MEFSVSRKMQIDSVIAYSGVLRKHLACEGVILRRCATEDNSALTQCSVRCVPCVSTHQDASNGRAHPLTLIVKSSAVTIVSGCVAHSRSVAFGVPTRVLYPAVRRAASRDNFSVYRGYYTRVRSKRTLVPSVGFGSGHGIASTTYTKHLVCTL